MRRFRRLAAPLPANAAALDLAVRIGFAREGVLRGHLRHAASGARVDLHLADLHPAGLRPAGLHLVGLHLVGLGLDDACFRRMARQRRRVGLD